MTETSRTPGRPPQVTPGLPTAMAALLTEAENCAREIACIRSTLEAAELKRRKLVTAIEACDRSCRIVGRPNGGSP